MTDEYSGSCLCKKIAFTITGQFERFFLCHCEYCQKDTGSAHAANLFSSTADLKWLSGADNIANFTLPGTRHVKSFCVTCGSAVPNIQMDGKLLMVPAGSLNSTIDMRPEAHIFTDCRPKWDDKLELIPGFDKFPE